MRRRPRPVCRFPLAMLLGTGAALLWFTASTSQSPAADLEVFVNAPSDAVVGRGTSFSAIVSNHGPDPATGVRVVVSLSGSFDLVSIDPRGASCAPPDRSGAIVCDVAALPVDFLSGVVTVGVIPTAEGEIAMSATVSANEPDPVPGNNMAGASVRVGPAAGGIDLSLVPFAGGLNVPTEVFVGQATAFETLVANFGPGDATGVRLRVTVTGAFSDLGGITISPPGSPCASEGAGTLVCDLGELGGRKGLIETVFSLFPTEPGTITIDAEVSANEPDLDASNNVASALITVRVPLFADLGIALADSPDPVHVGQDLAYDVTAMNNGPDAASDVGIVFLPADAQVVSIETSQGTCDLPFPPRLPPVPFVECALGRLEPGGSASIRIEALPTASGTLTSGAFVSNGAPGEFDPRPGNDSGSVTTTVLGPNRAATFTTTQILPTSVVVFVPCAGDVVMLEGRLHSRFHLAFDPAGGVHLEALFNSQGVSGVALGSGASYRGTSAASLHQTFSPPLSRTLTVVDNQRFVGQGAAADLIVHQDVHVTITPDGAIHASVDNVRIECR